jgi:hypothetical protein
MTVETPKLGVSTIFIICFAEPISKRFTFVTVIKIF